MIEGQEAIKTIYNIRHYSIVEGDSSTDISKLIHAGLSSYSEQGLGMQDDYMSLKRIDKIDKDTFYIEAFLKQDTDLPSKLVYNIESKQEAVKTIFSDSENGAIGYPIFFCLKKVHVDLPDENHVSFVISAMYKYRKPGKTGIWWLLHLLGRTFEGNNGGTYSMGISIREISTGWSRTLIDTCTPLLRSIEMSLNAGNEALIESGTATNFTKALGEYLGVDIRKAGKTSAKMRLTFSADKGQFLDPRAAEKIIKNAMLMIQEQEESARLISKCELLYLNTQEKKSNRLNLMNAVIKDVVDVALNGKHVDTINAKECITRVFTNRLQELLNYSKRLRYEYYDSFTE